MASEWRVADERQTKRRTTTQASLSQPPPLGGEGAARAAKGPGTGMDANVVAALISVGGSAALAATGAIAQWVRKRKRRRTVLTVLAELREHPCLTLSSERAITIICCDEAKGALLNAMREAVLLHPVERALSSVLDALGTQGASLTSEDVELAFSTASEFLRREQLAQLSHFPVPCHEVARRLLEAHRAALAPAVELQANDFSPERLLETLFSVFYVATYSTASQWSQTANQLNGQLNGVTWEGQRLQYTFQGNVSDAARILGNVLGGTQDVLGQDCIAAMMDATGRLSSITMGCIGLLGYRPQELIGKPLSALQLGISDLPGDKDLSLLEAPSQGAQMLTRVRRADGENVEICAHVDQVILSVPESRVCQLALLLFPIPSRKQGSSASNIQELEEEAGDSGKAVRDTSRRTALVYSDEDLHTRFALLVSALTHPTRRVMTGSFYSDTDHPLVVSTVVDGAPDLPLLETGKPLHTQLGLSQRRVAEACSRAGRRVQDDLLRSSTLSYTWRGTTLAAELYLIGREDKWAIFTIHRPLPVPHSEAASLPESGAPALTARPRAARVVSYCLPRCSRGRPLG